MPPAGLVFVSLPLPKKVNTKLVLTGSFEKNAADTRNQTLLELMTRPSEMCCVACRERTPWGWNKMEVIYQKRHGHKRKPRINTFSASDLMIGVGYYTVLHLLVFGEFVLLIIEFNGLTFITAINHHRWPVLSYIMTFCGLEFFDFQIVSLAISICRGYRRAFYMCKCKG